MADKDNAERGVLTRNFGAMVTGVVSLIAIGFGFLQFHLENARIEQEKAAERERAERAWKLALTQFGTENYDEIFSGDEVKRARLRALMKATFPADLLEAFYEQQTKTATTFEAVRESSEAYAAVSRSREVPRIAQATTAYLQYADPGDLDQIDRFLQQLRSEGFRTPGRELVTKFEFGADVRYFHDGDREAAERALAALRSLLDDSGRAVPGQPKNLGGAYPNVPKGIIEIWVPDLRSG